jgi:hypothetical protein
MYLFEEQVPCDLAATATMLFREQWDCHYLSFEQVFPGLQGDRGVSW